MKGNKDDESFTKDTLRGCTKLRYLWVVRTTKVVKPKPGASAVDRSKKTETTSFTPGVVEGEVLGYEIATGKLLGGYRFAARNSPTPEGANTGNADAVLEKDLTKNVVAALEAGANDTMRSQGHSRGHLVTVRSSTRACRSAPPLGCEADTRASTLRSSAAVVRGGAR